MFWRAPERGWHGPWRETGSTSTVLPSSSLLLNFNQPLPLNWSIATLYNSFSFCCFLCPYLGLLPDWLQLRIFICSTKRVSDLHRCYQIPLYHTRLRSFSHSPQSTRKPSTSPSRQSSSPCFRKEILGLELNPKYLLVPALRSQLLFQIIRPSSAK